MVKMNQAHCNMATLHDLIEPVGYLIRVDGEYEPRMLQHGNAKNKFKKYS